jgi:membrane-associated phospholipid phosphatase
MNFKTVLLIFLLPVFIFGQKNTARELKNEQLIQDIGDVTQFAPAVASLAFILIKNDKNGAWQFAKSFGLTLASSYTLKYTINKPRPEGATDGHAFPSGHTAVAFQGASFIQKRYGLKYGIPAYVVASFVGFSRLEGLDDRHDIWDVLAGATVGVGSSYLFTTPYQKEHLSLTFSNKKDNYLLGVVYKF